MVKFVVVLLRSPASSHAEFRHYFREVHEGLALALPGLRHYVQRFPANDPLRSPPRWDAVIELGFDDKEAMEEAWRSPEGQAASADLEKFVDLDASSWSLVEERRLLP